MQHTPTARRDRLIVRELEDETLVYDQDRDEAHCLNKSAALVWKHCDGHKTVAEIAALLDDELNAAPVRPKSKARSQVDGRSAGSQIDEQMVWLALGQLRRKRLLTERMPRASSATRISRREMAHRLAQAVVIALPLVTTIVAPRPASAGSCDPDCEIPVLNVCCPAGCPCATSRACCSGLCSAGTCT